MIDLDELGHLWDSCQPYFAASNAESILLFTIPKLTAELRKERTESLKYLQETVVLANEVERLQKDRDKWYTEQRKSVRELNRVLKKNLDFQIELRGLDAITAERDELLEELAHPCLSKDHIPTGTPKCKYCDAQWTDGGWHD